MQDYSLPRRRVLELVGGAMAAGTLAGGSVATSAPVGASTNVGTDHPPYESVLQGDGDEFDRVIGDDGDGSADSPRLSTATSESDADGVGVRTADNGIDVAVALWEPAYGGFGSDDTADLWVGAYKPTEPVIEPVEDESIEVTITGPGGTTDVIEVDTNEDGTAHVPCELADFEDGRVEVDIDHVDGDGHASVSFHAGPMVTIMNNRDAGIFVDDETTISISVRNGAFGLPGADVDITVENQDTNTELLDDTVTTNDEGFVHISISPEDPGQVMASAELTSGVHGDTERFAATEVTLGSGFGLREGVYGHETTYGGFLRTIDGQLADTELELTIRTDPFQEDPEVITEGSVTTDKNGFFLFPYEIPEDVEDDRLRVEAETADGRAVHIRFDRLRIDEFQEPSPPTNGDPDDPEEPYIELDVTVETDAAGFGRVTAPGGEVTVLIEATDDEEPIGGADVELVLTLGHDGPPLIARTLTTDADGTATLTFEVPDVEIDNVQVNGMAVLETDDTVVTDSVWFDIEKYDISFRTYDMEVGGDGTLELEVRDQLTGDPVSGVPLQFTTLYSTYRDSAIESGELVSDADGIDETTVTVPQDIGPSQPSINYVSRYTRPSTNRFRTGDHPGRLSIQDDDDTFEPGDTVTLSFDPETDRSATGIVFGRPGRIGSFGTMISSEEDAALELPAYTSGQNFNLRLWAADEETFYEDTVRIRVDEGVIESPFADYATEAGTIDSEGLSDAVTDWRSGELDTDQLRDVVDHWRTGEPVT